MLRYIRAGRITKKHQEALDYYDHGSRYTMDQDPKDHQRETRTIIKALLNWIAKFGPPETFRHDQGIQYTTKEMQTLLRKWKIKDIHTSAYNPTRKEISERLNQGIRFVLQHHRDDKIQILEQVIERRLNYTKHSFLGCSPLELVYGFRPLDADRIPIDREGRNDISLPIAPNISEALYHY